MCKENNRERNKTSSGRVEIFWREENNVYCYKKYQQLLSLQHQQHDKYSKSSSQLCRVAAKIFVQSKQSTGYAVYMKISFPFARFEMYRCIHMFGAVTIYTYLF